MRIIPDVKKIDTIKLAQPNTWKPCVRYFPIKIMPKSVDNADMVTPRETANLNGRPENAIIMSVANLILLLKS